MPSQRIHVTGIVQGVGFRPFVYALAQRWHLRGEVRNTSAGVDIAVEGDSQALRDFAGALQSDAPPLAHIDEIQVHEAPPGGYDDFTIRESLAVAGAFQPVSPDVALCDDCLRELFDPGDRRYLYPFINCTHCGPRFTIIRDLPYDRPLTTMAGFPLCPACAREYADPINRRFHAQPVACAECGPSVRLVMGRPRADGGGQHVPAGTAEADTQLPAADGSSPIAAILATRRLLREGAIVAIKGLGGFHLACDAASPAAVAELRQRKGRSGKPFAVMADSLPTAEAVADLNDFERALLTSREKPIVLATRRPSHLVAEAVAPSLPTLGLMLPYTPLHHLLLNQTDPVLQAEPAPRVLVMTSGNLSEEPIAIDNDEALARLAPLADAFLLHNRDIALRCDDSVVQVVEHASTTGGHAPAFLRRSRGYAPYPVQLPCEAPNILAVGGELKNTFCLTRERYAFMSQHIGDMENAETLRAFETNVAHMEHIFRVEPRVIVHDQHPDYLSTRWAIRNIRGGQQRLAVQHHHAHIAAVLADNGLDGARPVIGLAYDGTGYGEDGAIWGGEVLIADYCRFRRAAHLEYLPLPGGDAATRRPWRIALGYAEALGLDVTGLPFLREVDPREAAIVQAQVSRRLNAPLTSSMGRLFDAVAALAGVRGVVSYEAQAAIELEAAAASHAAHSANVQAAYPFHLDEADGVTNVRLADLLDAVVHDVRRGASAAEIGARFHQTVAAFSLDLCRRSRAATGLKEVALGGGVWQNRTLLGPVRAGLEANGFTVYTARQVPANDGGLALGQAAIAAHVAV